MNETPTKERSYVAFISYRHTPLDREAAERVQKKIENYIVPKEFREKVGGKKLGLCFRDEDELPASSSLTDSIYYALDHSKFLIVICTPNLPLSKWCEAEIRYFLKTHDRDHVLAVLADGDPSESFSPYMLHVYDDEGNITRDVEPLAANIAGANHTINNKAFKKEIVRLYAALIGCPFDELWQRERRARTNRLLSLAGAAVAVMAVFLGVVMNRNAMIEKQNAQITAQNEQITGQYNQIVEQNEQIQTQNARIEEQNVSLQTQLSSALVDSGMVKLKDHDLSGALGDAIKALESDDPAIYDHRVQSLLIETLGAYKYSSVQSSIVYEQAQPIKQLAVSDDDKYAVLTDYSGNISCISLDDYRLIWDVRTGDTETVIYTENLDGRVIYKTGSALCCCDISDGSLVWTYEHQKYVVDYFQSISEDGSIMAVSDHFGSSTYSPDNPAYIVFLSTKDGHELARTQIDRDDMTISTRYRTYDFAASFSDDNKSFACIVPGAKPNSDGSYSNANAIFLIDLDTFEKTDVGVIGSKLDMIYGIDVGSDGSVFLSGYSISMGGVYTALCTRSEGKFEYALLQSDHDLRRSSSIGIDMQFYLANECHFLSNGNVVLIFSDDDMFIFDRNKNQLLRSYAMSGAIVNAYWTDPSENTFEVFMSDGSITAYVLGTQNLFDRIIWLEDFDQTNIRCAQPLSGGMINNNENGMYLTAGGEARNHILLAKNATDPGAELFSFPELKEFSYYNQTTFLPGSDTAFGVYNGQDVFTFNRKTGDLIKAAHFDNYFSLDTFLPVDGEHFVAGDKIYSMDGTAGRYGEPFFEDTDDPKYPEVHYRQSDGSLLSLCEYPDLDLSEKLDLDEYREMLGPYPSMILLWHDGKPVEFSADPERALLLKDEYMNGSAVVTSGGCGMIAAYGRRIVPKDGGYVTSENNEFHFLDPFTEKITTMEELYPDSGEFSITVGNKKHLAAVLYDDGNICVYEPDAGTVSEPDHKYSAGEVSALAFSGDDSLLVILTSSGRIDLYDTESMEQIYSETIDALRDRIMFYDWDFYNIAADYSADKSRLLLTNEEFFIIMDPESLTIDAVLEDVLAYDPEMDRIYQNGSGSDIITYPLYGVAELKEWAVR